MRFSLHYNGTLYSRVPHKSGTTKQLTKNTHDDQAHREQEHPFRSPAQGAASISVGTVGGRPGPAGSDHVVAFCFSLTGLHQAHTQTGKVAALPCVGLLLLGEGLSTRGIYDSGFEKESKKKRPSGVGCLWSLKLLPGHARGKGVGKQQQQQKEEEEEGGGGGGVVVRWKI